MKLLFSFVDIVQIVCVLHQDLLDDPKMVDCYNYLASLELSLEAHRVMYSYKKPSGKVVKQVRIRNVAMRNFRLGL